jgi:polar amino acid transport system substrate-binding protein
MYIAPSFHRRPLRAPAIVTTALLVLCSNLTATTSALAGPVLDRIKDTGHIKLGYVGDARPFSFNGASGPEGYAITLCQRIVDGIQKQLALQGLTPDWELVAVDRRLAAVESRNVDLLCSPVSVTLGNRERVSFSIPIFAGGNRAVIRTDASAALRNALSEQRVTKPVWRGSPAATLLQQTSFAAMAGTSTEKWLKARREFFQVDSRIQTVSDYRTGLKQVSDRKVDVFFGERSIILGALGSEEAASRENLVILDRMFTHETLALPIPRGDEEFRVIVDRSLSQLYASEEFATLYTKWLGPLDTNTRTFVEFVALAE